jgi:acyl-coenzyme A synthetase/AMP-(fatty) acid ligase
MSASTLLPLLAPRALSETLAWRQGEAISGSQFIAEARALAATLPEGTPVNLCKDRYLFALALAAALIREQTSQLPPSALPALLTEMKARHASAYVLCDEPVSDTAGLPQFLVTRPAGSPSTAGADVAVHGLQPDVPQIRADLAAVCLLTSGSTGMPQPHTKAWGELVANIGAEAEGLATLLERPSLAGLTLVATVPPQHSYGLESSVLLALLGGARFDSCRPFYPADIAQTLADIPTPRALVTTPFHLKTLLLSAVPLPPVALVVSATAPLSPQLAAQAESQFQGRLAEIYGCTEAGQVALRRTAATETWTTLGQLRVWRETAEAGGEGSECFVVCGGHVSVPTPLADVLELDDERHFRLLGRANDLIHVAGKRSSLAHLSFQLNRIPGVEDGVFWMPPETADSVTRPIALVVAPSLSATQIIQALRAQVDPAFLPRRVISVAALPRTATGKITAHTLAEFGFAALAVQAAQERIAPVADAPAAAATVGLTPAHTPAPKAEIAIHIPAEHPSFAGHFPGQPILPGVVLLSLVREAIAAERQWAERLGETPQLDQVKFLAPVGPGAHLAVALSAPGRGVAFEVRLGTTVIAKGQFSAS